MIALCLCFFVFDLCLQRAQAKTTCIVTSVEDEAGMLSCFFSEDISLSKKDFAVYRYTNNEKQDVVNCFWASDQITCVTKAGVEFNKTVSDRVTLPITWGIKDETGQYACEVKGSKPQDFDFCEFSTLKSTCQVQSVTLLSESNLTCYFPEDISQSKKDFTVYHYTDQGHPVAVVICRWLSDDIKCITQPGYEYDRTVSVTTTIRIPRVTREETGKYTCSIRGSTLEDSHFCDLTLSTETTPYEVCSLESGGPNTMTCLLAEDVGQSKKDFVVYRINDDQSQDAVIKCSWRMENLDCSAKPGYCFSRTVSDRFVVASKSQTGSYLCQISGSRAADASSCSFLSEEGKGISSRVSLTSLLIYVSSGLVAVLFLCIVFYTWRRCTMNRGSKSSLPVQESEQTAVNLDEHPDKYSDEHTAQLGHHVQGQGKIISVKSSGMQRGAMRSVLKRATSFVRHFLILCSRVDVTLSRPTEKCKVPVQTEDAQTTLELLENTEPSWVALTHSPTNSAECDTHRKEKKESDYVVSCYAYR